MIKIGITGSLASGKSTVAKMISSRKYPVYNADKVVKKIYKTNVFKTKVFKKFKLKNKKNVKNKIKKIISSDKKYLKDLEKIIHPLVRKQIIKFTKKNRGKKFLIFEIPLLIESKQMQSYDKIIFVNSRKDLRLKRYLKSKGIETSIHYPIPIHLQPALKKLKYKFSNLNQTEKQSKKIITLPINQFLKESEIKKICFEVNNFYENI